MVGENDAVFQSYCHIGTFKVKNRSSRVDVVGQGLQKDHVVVKMDKCEMPLH